MDFRGQSETNLFGVCAPEPAPSVIKGQHMSVCDKVGVFLYVKPGGTAGMSSCPSKLFAVGRDFLFFCPPGERRQAWDDYREELMLLPRDTVELFTRIKYLPKKAIAEYIIRYAILAANSLIQNNDAVIL